MKKKSTTPNVRKVKAAAGEQYTAKQITVLEGLEPVRRRPGMYIGSTGASGLHHLVWEVIDNSIDEAMGDYCDEITATLHPGNLVSVEDNGRGIPVDIHKQYKVSALELVMTKLHAGGKFGEGGYKVSGGLHGVGVSVVNALSTYLKAEVYRDGKIWAQEYIRGKPKTKVKAVGKTSKHGTKITFEADAEIFEKVEYNLKTIYDHLRQQAFLTKGVTINIVDERIKNEKSVYSFYFEGGIASFIHSINRACAKRGESVFYAQKEVSGVNVEIAVQYTDDFKETVLAFANNIYNPDGGMHLMGFRTALTRVLNNYARKQGYLKEKEDNLTGEDVREGLNAVISVKIKNPQFEGQTKSKLGNPEARTAVEAVTNDAFAAFLEEHPKDGEAIITKCILSAKARIAAKAARETVIRKGFLEGMTLPGKLADCSSRDSDKSELYIVEGDSAGGSARQGRDRDFQAILPLRGKILNIEKSRLDKMLANNEIKSLIIALGTNIGEQFNIENLRYNKIILMTDADVDGAHIRTLLLTLFFRHFPEIIKQGHLYIAQPPLYRLQHGKEILYAYNDEEKEKLTKQITAKKEAVAKLKPPKQAKKKKVEAEITAETAEAAEVEILKGVSIQRYKGLGEMNPEQLWETTMNPANRLLKIVTIEDAKAADEIFDILMGTEVEPRKRFIQTRAKSVKNLDI